MVDENGNDEWYNGKAVSVLDDDKFNDECEFQVEYDEYDECYEIQVVKEWRMNCIVVVGSINDVVEVECKRAKKVSSED